MFLKKPFDFISTLLMVLGFLSGGRSGLDILEEREGDVV
jgi:hypothetical protein